MTEPTREQRIVSALESIGVNLDETDIQALEIFAGDADNIYRSERTEFREDFNARIGFVQQDQREREQEQANAALAAAGFVLNDEDGETWNKGRETAVIELENGVESIYKWSYELAPTPGIMGWAGGNCDSGRSGEFHRLLALIAQKPTENVTSEPCVSNGGGL